MLTVAHPLAPAQPDTDPWLSVHQAAARVLCNPATIRRLIAAGRLRHARIGVGNKIIRIRASWLDRCLEESTVPKGDA